MWVTLINAAQVGLQYQYKRTNLVGIVLQTDGKYSVCFNGVFELRKYKTAIGIEAANSVKILERNKIYSTFNFDFGYTYQLIKKEDSTGFVKVKQNNHFNGDLLWGLGYSPIEQFSIFGTMGIGTSYTQVNSIAFEFLPAIGIRILIPKKVNQKKIDK